MAGIMAALVVGADVSPLAREEDAPPTQFKDVDDEDDALSSDRVAWLCQQASECQYWAACRDASTTGAVLCTISRVAHAAAVTSDVEHCFICSPSAHPTTHLARVFPSRSAWLAP